MSSWVSGGFFFFGCIREKVTGESRRPGVSLLPRMGKSSRLRRGPCPTLPNATKQPEARNRILQGFPDTYKQSSLIQLLESTKKGVELGRLVAPMHLAGTHYLSYCTQVTRLVIATHSTYSSTPVYPATRSMGSNRV